MKRLTKEQIMMLHRTLIAESGGSAEIRDEGLLDSAINAPFQTFGGEELYPSLLEKASRLGYGLIKNHPFVDGNKRTGTHTMLVFLAVNHIELQYKDADLIQLILGVAAGEYDEAHLLAWLQHHIE
jgi:death-on-curing protein